jgi:serine/threonine-protein kinase
VAKLGGQVAMGLEYAHEQGVVHRDVKTANLFFTNKKTVKIMDFGLAKMTEEVRRATTVIGGTPYYMAPEQSAGEAIDRRADIYALGVTLYELLSGSVPFKEGDVAFHHRHTKPPRLKEVAPDVPDAFAELIAKMLEKKPGDRIESAGIVREKLGALARS